MNPPILDHYEHYRLFRGESTRRQAYLVDVDTRDQNAMNYWRTFGVVLAETRAAHGLSQQALAERAGVHRTYVSRVESSIQSPTLLTIYYFAHAVEMPPSELLHTVEARISRCSS